MLQRNIHEQLDSVHKLQSGFVKKTAKRIQMVIIQHNHA